MTFLEALSLRPILYLPFDGKLSPDELRMAQEETYAWTFWERE